MNMRGSMIRELLCCEVDMSKGTLTHEDDARYFGILV